MTYELSVYFRHTSTDNPDG